MNFDDFPDIQLANAYHTVSTAWQHAWEMPPRLEISQWADAYRKIARGSGAEPGQWRTDRHPPLRENHELPQRPHPRATGQLHEIRPNWRDRNRHQLGLLRH
ncbi:hypothetical protein [Xylella fastidiosa]|uniref:hypothetical protein n=1 Tax=Xylella fastidiosa TaxID=2371 RepID=UPI001E4859DD